MEKTCESCKYFYQHYGWSDGRFAKIFCGHCLNNIKIKKSYEKACADWTETDCKRKDQKRIFDILSSMESQLRDIKNYLAENE